MLLYLDEIQYFNKKQQQSLLEFIEDGRITLIASTTENPYFCVFNAILSRSTVFEFKPVDARRTLLPAVERALWHYGAAPRGAGSAARRGVQEHIAHGLRRRRAQGHERGGAAALPPSAAGKDGARSR